MRGTTRSDFGQRLFAARKFAGKTQVEVAKAVGMAQPTLAEAENTAAGSKYTAQLAAVLGVRGEWLATGEGAMVEPSAWPFKRIDIQRVLRLSPSDLDYVEGRLEEILTARERPAQKLTESPTQQQTDTDEQGTNVEPGQKRGAILDRLASGEASLASRKTNGVRKQGAGGNAGGAPRGRKGR